MHKTSQLRECLIWSAIAVAGALLLCYCGSVGLNSLRHGPDPDELESIWKTYEFEVADRTPQWYGDGQAIVVSDGYRFFRVSAAGDELEELGDKPRGRAHYSPSLSPDGQLAYQVYYFQDRRLERRIEVIGADELARSLAESDLNSSFQSMYPVWSPDGERLAFVRVWRRHQVVMMSVDGTDVTSFEIGRRASDRYGSVRRVAWSNDSQRIAFLSERSDWTFGYDTAQWDGSERTPIAAPSGTQVLPAWSPGGDLLYIVKGDRGESSLYSVGSDGTGEHLVADLGRDDIRRELQMSPDGSRLLMDGRFLINVDGTGFTRFNEGSGLDVGHASWSPDGSRIAVSNPWMTVVLYTMAPDGSDVRALLRRSEDGSLELGYGEPVVARQP